MKNPLDMTEQMKDAPVQRIFNADELLKRQEYLGRIARNGLTLFVSEKEFSDLKSRIEQEGSDPFFQMRLWQKESKVQDVPADVVILEADVMTFRSTYTCKDIPVITIDWVDILNSKGGLIDKTSLSPISVGKGMTITFTWSMLIAISLTGDRESIFDYSNPDVMWTKSASVSGIQS